MDMLDVLDFGIICKFILFNKIDYEYFMCFVFFRYGGAVGTLNVYLFNGSYTIVWSLSGNRGNDWYEGQVSYESLIPHQIIVEGIAGNDFLVRMNLTIQLFFFNLKFWFFFREIFQ